MPALNVNPTGSVPVSDNVGAGKPVAATVNVPAVPTVNVVLFALILQRLATVSKKLWVEFGETPFCAIMVMEYVPPVPAAGVPLITPVPRLKVTPVGSGPVSLNVGFGDPVAVTMNDPAEPTVNVALFALDQTGWHWGWVHRECKLCVAGIPIPF